MKNNLKHIGEDFPTIFNLGEIWRINTKLHGKWYNWIILWTYPIAIPFLLFYTILCLIGYAATNKENRERMRKEHESISLA